MSDEQSSLRSRLYRLLRSIEKYTKTDMVYVAKGGFWLVGSQIGTSAMLFALSVGFANLLPAEQYGIYRYLISLSGIVAALSLSGLPTAIVRSVARGHEGALRFAFFKNLRWSAFMVLASAAGAMYYFSQGNFTLGAGMLVIGGFSPIIDSAELYNAFLIGKKEFKTAAVFRLIRTGGTVGLLLLALVWIRNPLVLVVVYFLSHVVTAVPLFLRALKSARNDSVEQDLLSFSKHLSVLNTVAAVADRVDSILLFHFFGPVQLAVYNFALVIPNSLRGIIKNISTLATPKFASMENAREAGKAIARKGVVLFLAVAPIVALYVAFAPLLFRIFFPQYLDAVWYSQLFSLALFFNAILPSAYLDAHRALRERYVITLSSNLLKLFLLTGGIVYFGITGAIVAHLISKLYGTAITYVLARRL